MFIAQQAKGVYFLGDGNSDIGDNDDEAINVTNINGDDTIITIVTIYVTLPEVQP